MDPYATLNVPTDATREEIRSAFVRVARSTHPDKAKTGSSQAANDVFAGVDEAYKILGDEQMRDAFDEYGESGVQALQILRAGKPASSISKSQLRKRVKLNDEILQDEKFPTRSTIRCHFQIVELINLLTGKWESPTSMFPGLDHVLIEQGTQFQISNKDVITFNAAAGSARRWKDTSKPQTPVLGALTLTYTMIRGLNLFEYSLTTSSIRHHPPKFSARGTRPLTKLINAELSFNADPNETGLGFMLTKQLSTGLLGHIQVGFGNQDGVLVGCRYEKGTKQQNNRNDGTSNEENGSGNAVLGGRLIQANLNIRPIEIIALQASWSEPVTKTSRLKTSFQFSLSNLGFEIESFKKHSEKLKYSGSVSLSLATGVTFKLKLHRGGAKYEFPVLISPKISLLTSFLTGFVPLTIQYCFRRILLPYRLKWRMNRREEIIQKCKELKQRARNQMLLMKSTSEMNKITQREKNGLVILSAKYGKNLKEDYDCY